MPGPVPTTAIIDGALLTIGFNTQLDPTGPSTNALEVRVNGDPVAIQSVGIGPFEVFVTLVEPVPAGAGVGVSYADPTPDDDFEAIQGVFVGDDAPDFLDFYVDNVTQSPTLDISVDQALLGDGSTATVTFTFSEAPTGFDASDVVATRGVISNFVVTSDPTVYTATFTPNADGMGKVEVANGAWTGAGAANGGGDSVDITNDLTPPGVTITVDDASLGGGQDATVTFTFSEAPVGFAAGDVTATNGAISGFAATADPTIYTATFTPTANGPASVGVADGAFADAAGNAGEGDLANLTADLIAPSVTVTANDVTLLPNQTATITFTFSETPLGFTAGDVATSNGAISGFTATLDPKVYTALFTPTGLGPAAVGVPGSVYTDAVGNLGSSNGVALTVAAAPAPPPTPPAPQPFTTEMADVVTLTTGMGHVSAGGGADQVTGSTSGDFVNGNAGQDTISAGAGQDTVLGGRDDDRVQGNAGEDLVFGDLGDDVVHGGRDNDTVQGNEGRDAVSGDAGDDVVRGGKGDDTVSGGDGADHLFGDLGDDLMVGGSGADVFHVVDGAAGRDIVADFSHADGDVIAIGSAIATDFDALLAHVTTAANGDAVIALGSQTIILAGVGAGSLVASDFLFG